MHIAREFARAFYHSAVWKQMRREILRRELYTCENCGGRATEVHHEIELTPENIGVSSISLNPRLLHALCHDCHSRITKGSEEVGSGYIFDESGQVIPR